MEPSSGVVFVLFFVLMWCGVTTLLSQLSGWPSLASRFPGGEAPAGVGVRGQVLGVGIVRENNVTFLVVSSDGLYLAAQFLFRLRRPPILVPWHQVRHVSDQKWLGWRSHVLDLGGITTIRLKNRAYELVEPFITGATSVVRNR